MIGSRDATAVFSDYAQDYAAPRRRLIPVFDEFYGAVEHAEQRRLLADTESLLRWLREAGFADVDCVFRWWRFGVRAGWSPAV